MLPSIEHRDSRRDRGQTCHKIAAAIALLDEGATVPFILRAIARRRRRLDDTQLRMLEDRPALSARTGSRRAAIIESITERAR